MNIYIAAALIPMSIPTYLYFSVLNTGECLYWNEAENICCHFSINTMHAARNRERGEGAVRQLEEEGLQPEFLLLDVDSEESIRSAKETVERKYGRLDVLINNAAVYLNVMPGACICEGAHKNRKYWKTMNLINL